MIEADIEDKIVSKISELISDYEIQSSWNFVDDGEVKEEKLSSKKGTISIYITPMAHDNFSLPTVNMNGVVTIESRVEMCPSMISVVQTFEAIQKQFSKWHYKAIEFSQYFSTDDFYATELMLTNGDKVTFDRNTNCWMVTFGFSIKGTQNFVDDLTTT